MKTLKVRMLMMAMVALLAACADNPTMPAAASSRGVGGASYDRETPSFDFTAIDIAGALATSPQGINAGGDISGLYVDANRHTHGFIRSQGSVTTIDYPGADYTDVRGIGPDGSVVGTFANNGEEAVAFHGFKRSPDGSFERVHFPGHLYEIPQRILPDGTILGCRHDHDLMGSMDGMEIAGADATEINQFASMNNGAVPGGNLVIGLFTNMQSGLAQAYTIQDGVFTSFMVPGSLSTNAWDVNPRGDIVGVYRNAAGFHGYVRTAAGFTTLDAPGASATRAFAINARGDVVGTYVAGGVTHGFLMSRR
ncbi:MAG TPA: hypothetical protein VJN70_19460 [Gemmatimonadaceae bacterium]|nr:hypothetical protein [Gemmatimonadaceae bacterium]